MSEKTIKIENLEDIIKSVPIESLDSFLEDLKQYVLFTKQTPIFPLLTIERHMEWIDDGKNEFLGADIKVRIVK